MPATSTDIEAGAAALKQYVEGISFAGAFVPWSDYEAGAEAIIEDWDAAAPGATDDAKTAACGASLFDAISNAGYGGSVTIEQCVEAATAVLAVTRKES